MTNCSATTCTITGNNGVGGLAGTANDGNTRTFTGCKVTNCTITGNEDAGSIVGWALTSTAFENCNVSGTTVNGVETTNPGNLKN